MSCIIFRNGTNARFINIRSPFDRNFADTMRAVGNQYGRSNVWWDRDTRVWRLDTRDMPQFTIAFVTQFCSRHYATVQEMTEAEAEAALEVTKTTKVQPVNAGYLGKLGERLTVRVEVMKVTDIVGQYGEQRFHTMRDDAGHVLLWRASSERLKVGEKVTLTGTVKNHDEYRGTSQTVLTRCKVHQAVPAQPKLVLVPPPVATPEYVEPEESGSIEGDPSQVKCCPVCHADFYGFECPYLAHHQAPRSLAEEVGF